MTMSIQLFVHEPPTATSTSTKNHSSWFFGDLVLKASELLENFEEIFLQYYMQSYEFSSLNLQPPASIVFVAKRVETWRYVNQMIIILMKMLFYKSEFH